jgi:hypothetical protein
MSRTPIKNTISLSAFLLITYFSAFSSAAEEATSPQSIAVVVLLSASEELGDPSTFVMMQRELETFPQIKVLPFSESSSRLGGDRIAFEDESDLEQLSNLFQQGYLQSYSFEYLAAEATLSRVLSELEQTLPNKSRWDLFVRSQIFRGIALLGLKDDEGCAQSFLSVLRTRPELQLNRDEYPPKTIEAWERAKKRLASIPHGKLVVESEPSGANVLLDGVAVGKTPWIGSPYQGRAHLRIEQEGIGGVSRWLEIQSEPVQVRSQLKYETSLLLRGPLVALRQPQKELDFPASWWPWLGSRLGIKQLIAVSLHPAASRIRWMASLVDLERGRTIRECWLELSPNHPIDDTQNDSRVVLEFLINGKPAERLQIPSASHEEHPKIGSDELLLMQLKQELKPSPWYRRWWPYSAAGAGLLAFGIGSHLTSETHHRASDKALTLSASNREKELSTLWLDLAVGSYILGGTAILGGVFADLTYRPENHSPPLVAPMMNTNAFLIQFAGEF